METSDMKKIVVLKNLHSNLIEEAIVVLKSNVKVKLPQLKSQSKEKEEKKSNYIVKEAEMHIAQYISGVENKIGISKENKDLEKKYERLKKITYFLAMLSLLGMIANLLK